jgi:hypothetical protein
VDQLPDRVRENLEPVVCIALATEVGSYDGDGAAPGRHPQ